MKSVRKKIFFGFTIMILLIAFLGIFGLKILNGVNDNFKSMYHNQVMGIDMIKEAQYNLGLVQRVEKNVLLATTIEEKKQHADHLEMYYSEGIIKNLNKYKNMSSAENGMITELIAKVNSYKKVQNKIITKSINGDQERAITLAKQSISKSKEIETIIKKIINQKLLEAEEYYKDTQESFFNAITLVVIAFVVTVVATVIMSYKIANSIVKPLHKSIDFAQNLSEGNLTTHIDNTFHDESGILVDALNSTGNKLKEIMLNIKEVSVSVDDSSEQLSITLDDSTRAMDLMGDSINDIDKRIGEVASSVETIDDKMEDIKNSSSGIIDITKEIEGNSFVLNKEAEKAENSVEMLLLNNSDIEIATKEVKNSIEELSSLSKSISEIVEIISNIASQTNLLALNANIEAARAGSSGKGFAVVAEEVRKLSDLSTSSAKKIEKMILMVQKQIETVSENAFLTESKVLEGSNLANNTSNSIHQVSVELNNITENIDKIKNECQQQDVQIELITTMVKASVENSQKVTESTKNINGNIKEQIETIQEIGATSTQLSSMTQKLNRMISYFKV